MADRQNDDTTEGRDRKSKSQDTSQKSVRQVVVNPLDAPPPSGKQQIHPRRPAPIVPTREERIAEQSDQDHDREKP